MIKIIIKRETIKNDVIYRQKGLWFSHNQSIDNQAHIFFYWEALNIKHTMFLYKLSHELDCMTFYTA